MSIVLKPAATTTFLNTNSQKDTLINTMKSLDFSKYVIDQASIDYIVDLLNRKVTSESKHKIISAIKNRNVEIVLLNKDQHFPNCFLAFALGNVPGQRRFYINLGYYAKFENNTIKEIDPRALFGILKYGFTMYKLYRDPEILHNNNLCNNVMSSFKKLVSYIFSKSSTPLNTMTRDDIFRYEIIVYYYISKVLLLKDHNTSLKYVESYMSPNSDLKNKFKDVMLSIDLESIHNLESFISVLKDDKKGDDSPFKKISTVLFLREYMMSIKFPEAFSCELIQYYIPLLVIVNVGSANIFKDQFIESILSGKEHTKIDSIMTGA